MSAIRYTPALLLRCADCGGDYQPCVDPRLRYCAEHGPLCWRCFCWHWNGAGQCRAPGEVLTGDTPALRPEAATDAT